MQKKLEKIIIEIECGNSAFEGSGRKECARILREIADDLIHGLDPKKPRDLNGNPCGDVTTIENI